MDITEHEFSGPFQDLGIEITDNDYSFLTSCLRLSEEYNVERKQFAMMWMAFMVEKGNAVNDLKIKWLNAMENAVLKPLKKQPILESLTKQREIKTISTFQEDMGIDYNDDILKMYGYKGPKPKEDQTQPSEEKKRAGSSLSLEIDNDKSESTGNITAEICEASDTPIKTASGASVLRKFGGNVTDWRSKTPWRVKVDKTADPHVPPGVLYMFELPSKKAAILQKVCREYGASLCAAWSKKTVANSSPILSDPTTQSQMPFRTWGRISPIEQTAEQDIGRYLMRLEGCKAHRRSNFINVDLSQLPSYSLFPGQIVGVEGKNATGEALVVSTVYDSGYPPSPPRPMIQRDLHMVVAAGPFVSPNNQDYRPLYQLLDSVAKNEPQLLMLIGPFLPVDSPVISNVANHYTHQEMFEQLVERIMRSLEGKCTQVVLVASCQDVQHDAVYPTPEYYIPKSMQSPNLHLMPDPCMLDLEGLVIGVTSVDIVRHLSSHEINKNMSGEERPARLANHILSQACFYPLNPAAELNVDVALWEKYAFLYTQPHILILPSDMRCFCKWTQNCFVVNPQRLKKQTYTRMIVTPCGDNQPWTRQRVSCEILKL